MSNSKPPVVWLPVTVFTVTTLVTLIAVPWYGLTVGYSASAWIAAVVVLFLNGISITAGYHRLWSHNAYKASLPVRVLFALFGAAATQNSIKVWASGHRRHHRHVDDNEKDPYSAGRGFWFSHIGWMCRAYPSGKVRFDNIKDLERDPVVEWQHKYYVPLALIMNFLPALAVGLIVGDIWSGILLAGFLRLVVSHHSTFFINSLAHIWGRRPYTHENSARDNDVLALFTYGEGYHNYHHIFQGDYRNGIRWWHYDPTKWLIWSMSKLGLANDLKRTEKAHIDAAIIATRLLEQKQLAQSGSQGGWLDSVRIAEVELQDKMQQWKELRGSFMKKQREFIANSQAQACAIAHAEIEQMKQQLHEAELSIKAFKKQVLKQKQLA